MLVAPEPQGRDQQKEETGGESRGAKQPARGYAVCPSDERQPEDERGNQREAGLLAPVARRQAHGRQHPSGHERPLVGQQQQAEPGDAGSQRQPVVRHARDVLKEQRMQAHQREHRGPGAEARHQALEGTREQHERAGDEQEVDRPHREDRLERP